MVNVYSKKTFSLKRTGEEKKIEIKMDRVRFGLFWPCGKTAVCMGGGN